MDTITFPLSRGIQEKELAQLIGTGWQCLGTLPIVDGTGVITPEHPLPGVVQAQLVFIRPIPMLPAGVVVAALQQIKNGNMTPDVVAKSLFGKTVEELEMELNLGRSHDGTGSRGTERN